MAVPIFVIPIAVQWWSTWYPGAEPGGGGYVARRMLAAMFLLLRTVDPDETEKNCLGQVKKQAVLEASPFNGRGMERVDYEQLRARLERTNAVFPVCASNVASSLPVAARWSPGGSRALPPGVDAFGEYGEFHTEVTFPDDVASLGGPGTATATDGA